MIIKQNFGPAYGPPSETHSSIDKLYIKSYRHLTYVLVLAGSPLLERSRSFINLCLVLPLGRAHAEQTNIISNHLACPAHVDIISKGRCMADGIVQADKLHSEYTGGGGGSVILRHRAPFLKYSMMGNQLSRSRAVEARLRLQVRKRRGADCSHHSAQCQQCTH